MQKYEESLKTLKKCLNLKSSFHGQMPNIYFVNMLESYAETVYDQRKFEQASELFEKCYKDYAKILG